MATTRKTVCKARQLRRTMSKPEVMLWQFLRKRPMGIKFRRQHPVGCYILDFYCPTVKLAIEIDGMAHDMGDRPAQDERRDSFLPRQGIAVMRIPAQDVFHDVEGVVEQIVRHIQELR